MTVPNSPVFKTFQVADELLKDASELRRPSASNDSNCRTSNATQVDRKHHFLNTNLYFFLIQSPLPRWYLNTESSVHLR